MRALAVAEALVSQAVGRAVRFATTEPLTEEHSVSGARSMARRPGFGP